MRNHFYENDFDLHENETAYRTHLHMKGFALRLVLKHRHKRTRKWPIQRTLNKDKSGKVKMRYLKNFLLVAEVIIYRKKKDLMKQKANFEQYLSWTITRQLRKWRQ